MKGIVLCLLLSVFGLAPCLAGEVADMNLDQKLVYWIVLCKEDGKHFLVVDPQAVYEVELMPKGEEYIVRILDVLGMPLDLDKSSDNDQRSKIVGKTIRVGSVERAKKAMIEMEGTYSRDRASRKRVK